MHTTTAPRYAIGQTVFGPLGGNLEIVGVKHELEWDDQEDAWTDPGWSYLLAFSHGLEYGWMTEAAIDDCQERCGDG